MFVIQRIKLLPPYDMKYPKIIVRFFSVEQVRDIEAYSDQIRSFEV